MKKVISILLCLLMLLSTVSLFASCSKKCDGITPQVHKKLIDIDLTGYALVYAADLTNGGKQQAIDMTSTIKKMTSVAPRAQQDNQADVVETDDLEILIGNTNRQETVKALSDIDGYGWTIRVFDNKLVIAGTTPFLTRIAMAYFESNYLNADHTGESLISVNKKVELFNMPTTTLVNEDGEGQYTIVYSDRVDDNDNPSDYNYAGDQYPDGGPDVDFTYSFSTKIQTLLISKTSARASTFPYKTDSTAAADDELELLVGNMDRSEMKEVLNGLLANEYAVSTNGGKIILAAWNDVTLDSTYALLADVLAGCAEEDAAGDTAYVIPQNCTLKSKISNNWEVDFPKPEGEGIQLDGTAEVGDYSIEYVYTGEGISRDAYVTYCEQLEAAGFELIAAENQVEGSSFRTYVNDETDMTLHVYHAAYTHAENQDITDALESIRIISASTDYVTVPDDEILNPNQDYEWRTTPKITQLQLFDSTTYDSSGTKLSNFGMSYVITLADGSFIIYDGGIGRADDEENLWNVLNELHTLAYDGVAPTADDPIHIRAWILTHEHSDHFEVFRKFLKKYGKENTLRFDRLLTNLTSTTERVNCHNPQNVVQLDMTALQSAVNGGFKYITVHTGQVFYFANLKMEILYTHEDTYPQRLEYFNNSSTVIRTIMDVKHMDGTADQSTCIWLGDVERIGSRRMLAMYGSTLKSDQIQVAHHGHTGVNMQFYEVVAPEVLWWPAAAGAFRDYVNEFVSDSKGNKRDHADTYAGCWDHSGCTSNAAWYYCVDYHLAYSLASVKLLTFAWAYNTTMEITGEDRDLINLINVADPDNSTIVYTRYYDGEVLRASSTAKQNSVILKQEIQ